MSEATKGNILPIYFVADESASMESVVGELNNGLTSLLDAMAGEQMAAAKVRLTILGFSNDARCYLELADMRELTEMPELTADGGTSYVAAFNELYNRLDDDVDSLKAQGYSVNRPAVFFLTDGEPTDQEQDWRAALNRLQDPSFLRHPNIISFGFGKAVPGVIHAIATDIGPGEKKEKAAYIAAVGTNVGDAVAKFCVALVGSIVNSANAAAAGNASLVVEQPKGFELVLDSV